MNSIIGKLDQIIIDLHEVAAELGNNAKSQQLRDIADMIASVVKRLRKSIS